MPLRNPDANRLRTAPVQPIQVPMAIGAMRAGVDRGAMALDDCLRRMLADRNRDAISSRLRDSVRIPVDQLELSNGFRQPGGSFYLEEVARAAARLADAVSGAIDDGALALSLGGDHALSIGTIAGAAARSRRLAVIWIDAHADMNWPEVSPSGRLHGMSLGVSMGRGPVELLGPGGCDVRVDPCDASLIGVRQLDPGEEDWLGEGAVNLVTMSDVDSLGIDAAIQHIVARINASDADAVHVSFDVDVLDSGVMAGTGTPVRGGFTYREASRILRHLRQADLPVRSLDWVELNPSLDPTGESTAVAAELLAVALGDDVLIRP